MSVAPCLIGGNVLQSGWPSGSNHNDSKYMSPEQCIGHQDKRDWTLNGRSAVFEMGLIIYELVTGEMPQGDLRESLAAKISVSCSSEDE